VQIIAPVIHATGQKVEEYSTNRSSIRQYRQKHRTELSSVLELELNTQKPLVLHWDRKLMADLTGDEKVDRLPIIVSGSETQQLLCVPKLPSGTGKATVDALMDTVSDCGITERKIEWSLHSLNSDLVEMFSIWRADIIFMKLC